MSTDNLPRGVVRIADGFWNIRGSFKLGGILEIGTQASLVRLASGKLVLLDTCEVSGAIATWLDRQTADGAELEAIVNLHPFHTLHVGAMARRYPGAKLYGTARHHEKLPELSWEPERVEEPELQERYADDLDFSIPEGVVFIADDPKVHFSSVLAFHPASRTLHVDDTLLYLRLPRPLRVFKRDVTRFHPTLTEVLEPRAGAAAEFRAWARELIERSGEIDNLCAAHSAPLTGERNRGAPIAERIEGALARVERKLAAHERRYGS